MFGAILKTDNSVYHATWLDIVHRTHLLQTAPSDRGLLWRAWSTLFYWAYEFPLYITGPTGVDKLVRASGGLPVPMGEGLLIFDYATIADMLMSDNQPRGRYLGTSPVPSVCLGKETLIFLPTTPGGNSLHDQLRRFVVRVVRGFYVNETADRGVQWMGEPVLHKDNEPEPSEQQVVRYLISTMFYRLFGRAPTSHEADTINGYFGAVLPFCFLGDGVLGRLAAKVSGVLDVRTAVLNMARQTPTGRLIETEAAAHNKNCSADVNRIKLGDCEPIDAEAMLQQLVDGYLFAGLLGTKELTVGALQRLRSHPALYGPMWRDDPVAFLVETARLNPPVSSVTAALDSDRVINIGVGYANMLGRYEAGGTPTLFAKDTPVQLSIAKANRDSSVFGHTANQFDPKRPTLDRVLSWNGVEGAVRARGAPRGCPGHDLAIDVARTLIDQFWNDKNSTPSGLPAPGDCFDGMECHAELDVSSVLVYSRLTEAKTGFELVFAVVAVLALLAEFIGCCLWAGPPRGLWDLLGRLIFSGDDPLAFVWKGALLAQTLGLLGYLRDATLPAHLSQLCVGASLLLIAALVAAGRRGWLFGYAASVLVLAVTGLVGAIVTVTSFGLGEYFAVESARFVAVFFLASVALCFFALYVRWPRGASVPTELYLAAGFGLAGVPLFSSFRTGVLLAVVCVTGFVYCFDVVLTQLRSYYLGRRVLLVNCRLVQPALSLLAVAVLLAPVALGLFQVHSAYHGVCTPWSMPNGTVVEPGAAEPLCAAPQLDRLDTYTRFVYGSIRSEADDESRTPYRNSTDIHPPVRRSQIASVEILNFPYYIPYQDEDEPVRDWQAGLLKWFADFITHSPLIFPVDDYVDDFDSPEQARRLTRLIAGPLAFNISDEETTSDEALVRWTFYGIGAHRIRRAHDSLQAGWKASTVVDDDADAADTTDESFVVDLLAMAALDVRPGYARYGAAAYFGSQASGFAPRRIALPKPGQPRQWRDVRPGDADWEYAKFVFRTSLLVDVTLADHLSTTHLRLSSVVVQAARETLETVHPIRLLLAPFSYGTIEINRGAASNLAAKLGVLHRAVALTWPALETAFRQSLTSPYAYLLDDQLDEQLADVVPYVQDGADFRRVVHSFVDSYLRVYYPDDDALYRDADLAHFLRQIAAFGFPVPPIRNRQELIHLLREFIVVVTGYHYHVGQVAQWVLDPYGASGKIRPGLPYGDVQTTVQVNVIALFTSYPKPMLLANFSHLLLRDDHYPVTNAIFDKFHADLDALVAVIDERNRHRRWPVLSFNPRVQRSAVSI